MSDAFAPAAATPARDPASRAALAVGWGALWLFLVAMLLSGYEVVARYLFNAPSTWIHATTTAMCAVAFAFGGAWCLARREHISVTMLSDNAGPRLRRVIEIGALLVGLFYLAGLGWGLWLDAAGSIWRFDFAGRWTPELTPGPPNWPLPSLIKVSLVLGTVLFALVALTQLVGALRRPRDR